MKRNETNFLIFGLEKTKQKFLFVISLQIKFDTA